jgi:hypothetical protein
MSSVLVLLIVLRLLVAMVRLTVLGCPLTPVSTVAGRLVIAGGRRRLKAVHDHATRKRGKDKRARDKDDTDHPQSVKDVSHQVTHYQRRTLFDRSLSLRRPILPP